MKSVLSHRGVLGNEEGEFVAFVENLKRTDGDHLVPMITYPYAI